MARSDSKQSEVDQTDHFARWVQGVYHSLFFPPFVIFVAILTITFWSWRATRNNLNGDIRNTMVSRESTIQNDLKQRLSSYEQILVGGAGLFRASGSVTGAQWHNYVSTFEIDKEYPGVQSIGYLLNTPRDQLDQVVATMRSQGNSTFTITPTGDRNNYTPVLYLEPQSSAAGLDMSVDPIRARTLENARDTGQSTLTPPTSSLVPNMNNNQLVFFLFSPQYRPNLPATTPAERRLALQGYVYAGFRSNDFFNSMFKINADDKNLGFRVWATIDGSMKPFYTSSNFDNLMNASHHTSDKKSIALYGQTWTFEYVLGSETLTSTQQRSGPIWVWVLGITLGVLLGLVIYLLLKTRSNELSLQKEKAIDVAKDELLSLASHQLRTPATTVKQYLGMVLQGFAGNITTAQRKLLQNAYAGNERQLYIINEMLHVAKVDSGRITLARKKTDIVNLVKTVVKELKGDISASGHTLKTSYPKKPLIMNIDEHMLRMAIENLLSNAIKYTPTGGKIEIGVAVKSNRVRITVKDNGVGINNDDIPKIYKLFTRVDNSMTETVGGTGVGLYLAKHLVELHHGRIIVESEPGEGSCFSISLPYRRLYQ